MKTKIAVIIIAIIIILIPAVMLQKQSNVSPIESLGYKNIESRNVPFEGYDSQRISAEKGTEKFTMQVVSGLTPETSTGIVKKFDNAIASYQKNFTFFDPYTATTIEASLPDVFKPVRTESTINSRVVIVYTVHADDVLSLYVPSAANVKYKGVAAIFYCEKTGEVYYISVYSYPENFSYNEAVQTISAFCR